MDLITGAMIAYISKEGINKLLGPTFDYMGGELSNYAEKAHINLGKIFKAAYERLGDKINKPGIVSPRVFKKFISEGAYCEDALLAEYWGGVMASARSDDGLEDQQLRMTKLLESMTLSQIKTHYLIYSTILKKSKAFIPYSTLKDHPHTLMLYISCEEYANALSLDIDEDGVIQILSHSLVGLYADSLVEEWTCERKMTLAYTYPAAKKSGLVVTPSMLGMELFLSACGLSFFTHGGSPSFDNLNSPMLTDIKSIEHAVFINRFGDLKQKQEAYREKVSIEFRSKYYPQGKNQKGRKS
ncbi:hypothetical protein C4J81_04295 [Deltaproteobacteria bacterium Smac51]|nr:hypothetical protein C4J81_04295 [Deltaproteobacteria bacterium Smac51]